MTTSYDSYCIKHIKHQHLQIQVHKEPYKRTNCSFGTNPYNTPLVPCIQWKNGDQQRRAVIAIVWYLHNTWGSGTGVTSYCIKLLPTTPSNSNTQQYKHMHLLFVHGQYTMVPHDAHATHKNQHRNAIIASACSSTFGRHNMSVRLQPQTVSNTHQ